MRLRNLLLLLALAAFSAFGQNTPKFPGALPTYRDLPLASNRAATTLSGALGAGDTTINVVSTALFTIPAGGSGVITIDDERISVCSKTATAFTVCSSPSGRGYDNSSAASHLSGADVRGQIVAHHQNQTIAELIAIATALGTDGDSGITSLNGLTGLTQTFAAGTAGADFGISSSGTAHTFNLPSSSSSNRGLLTSADWAIFNAKVATSRILTAGVGIGGGGDLSADRTFTWNPSTFVDNVTLWDSSQASRTFTFGLSGATDPVLTLGNGTFNLSTGTLQQGGTAVSLSGHTHAGGDVTSAVATATALAANPADCAANQFATTIAASGNLGCAAIADGDLPAGIARDSEINVQGTADEISSTGAGVAPTLSLPATLALGGKTLLGGSPLVMEGATADAFETTVVVTDPTADRNFTLPNADSVAVQPLSCSGSDKVSAVSALGVVTCSADVSGGTPAWESLVNSADSATAYTSNNTAETVTFSFEAAFGASQQFLIRQQTGNPTAGTLLDVRAADAQVTVLRAGDGTNGITVSQAGALTAEGTGAITATLGDSATSFFGAGTLENARLDSDVGALGDNSTNGLWARTGAGTGSARTITGTTNEVDVSNGDGVSGNPTLSLSATVDLGGKTSFEIPNAAAPTTDAFGEVAGDNNAWAASRGAVQVYDGTANTYLVGALASDTPTNGQVPTWKTGGTVEWETPAGGTAIVQFSSGGPTGTSPADNTTYYIGCVTSEAMGTTARRVTCLIPKTGTINTIHIAVIVASTLSTTETSTIYYRAGNTTDTAITTGLQTNTAFQKYSGTSLGISVSAGDDFEIKWVTPNPWATNPAAVLITGMVVIE